MANARECWEQYWTSPDGSAPQDTSCTATCLPSRKLYKLDEPDTQDTAGEARINSSVMYSYGPPHMAKQKQDDQLKHIYSSYLRIWDVALKTSQMRWMIGRSGERGSGISMLAARHDDDDDDILLEWVKSVANLGNVRQNLADLNIFAEVVKMMCLTGQWNAELTWYSLSVAYQIYIYGLKSSLRIHSLRPAEPCLIVKILATWAKFCEICDYSTVINCAFTFCTMNVFHWFHGVMTQFKLIKHTFPNQTIFHVHLCVFHTTNGVKQCTCQYTNYYDTGSNSSQFPWLELVRSNNIHIAN